MARTPGPIWTEINNDLISADNFVFLKDAAKAALLTWAILYPSGNLPPLKQLARDLAKDGSKAFALLGNLKGAGFVATSPNGSLSIVPGWARKHKGSASRMAKMRAGAKANCDVTIDHNVTSHTASHRADSDVTMSVTSDVTVTSPKSQKEIPLRNPLRKTPTSKDEVGVSARERAPHTGKSLLSRDYWPEGRPVPDSWLRTAEMRRRMRSCPPIDMGLCAEKFTIHYGAQQNQARTETEWQAQFLKFALSEKAQTNGFNHGTKSRQVDELARIIARESGAALDGEILQNGDGFPDRPDDFGLPGEAWREHGSTRQ